MAEDNPGDIFLVRRALEKHNLDVDLARLRCALLTAPTWMSRLRARIFARSVFIPFAVRVFRNYSADC